MINKQKSNINQIRKANHVILNKKIINLLDGLLLGDGSLSTQRQNISAYYEHGDKNISYLVWLSDVFNKHGIKQSGIIYLMKKVKNGAYKYKSLSYFEFGEIRKRWYPHGKKKIPSDLIITPTILKFWYVGDGNFSDKPLIDSSIFDMDSLKRVSKQLSNINIKHTLREFRDRKRIRISAKSQRDFFEYINSDNIEIPECYRYKFPKEITKCH